MSERGQRERAVAVYCIAEIQSPRPLKFDLFKIGVAKNVMARVAGLQTGNPRLIRPILVDWYRSREEAIEAERAIHEYIGPHTVRGEWFSFNEGAGGCPFEAMACAPRPYRYFAASELYYDYDFDLGDSTLLDTPIRYEEVRR